jgi:hypothetical protein
MPAASFQLLLAAGGWELAAGRFSSFYILNS